MFPSSCDSALNKEQYNNTKLFSKQLHSFVTKTTYMSSLDNH